MHFGPSQACTFNRHSALRTAKYRPLKAGGEGTAGGAGVELARAVPGRRHTCAASAFFSWSSSSCTRRPECLSHLRGCARPRMLGQRGPPSPRCCPGKTDVHKPRLRTHVFCLERSSRRVVVPCTPNHHGNISQTAGTCLLGRRLPRPGVCPAIALCTRLPAESLCRPTPAETMLSEAGSDNVSCPVRDRG